MFWFGKRKEFEDPEKFLTGLISGVVAELGCGDGYYCQYLVKYAEKLYCVDKNKALLEEAKMRVKGNNVIFLNEDASRTSIPPSSIDIVLFANSFHDMNKGKVYEEVKRILKPYGKVIIVDWKKAPTPFGPPLSIRMDKEDYLRIFKDFELEKELDVGPYHFCLVLKRVS
ncbi:MAG: class I SAM-dependent methyltransferase [Sulfolobaceae archaeon]